MQKRENFLPIFLIFFILSILVFKSAKTPFIRNFSFLVERAASPLSKMTLDFFSLPKTMFKNTEVDKLKEENRILLEKIVDQQELQKENNALKDQFKTTYPKSQNLIPAKIIGRQNQNLVLDKGSKDNIKVGQAVVFGNNLIGKIGFVTESLSKVLLISQEDSSFAVKTLSADRQALETSTLGVIKGLGEGGMVMGNVFLSENLKTSDIVLTSGDLDTKGLGYPANLVVGKIESIDKKPSSLFQSGKVKSLVDISSLSTVFIVVGF